MPQQITIDVSEKVLQRASVLVREKSRNLKEVLEEWLEETIDEIRIEDLSDEEILALTESEFDDEQQRNFSRLLKRNREETLAQKEKLELDKMMKNYENGLLRKSKALREAVSRGLIASLQS